MILQADAEILWQEKVVKDSYDPSICFLYNPRTQYWLICQDLRLCKKKSRPLVVRDEDLDGVVGIGEMTPFVCLLRCEFADGVRFTPNAALAIKLLNNQTKRRGELSPYDLVKKQEDERNEARRKKIKDKAADVYDGFYARLRGRKVFA